MEGERDDKNFQWSRESKKERWSWLRNWGRKEWRMRRKCLSAQTRMKMEEKTELGLKQLKCSLLHIFSINHHFVGNSPAFLCSLSSQFLSASLQSPLAENYPSKCSRHLQQTSLHLFFSLPSSLYYPLPVLTSLVEVLGLIIKREGEILPENVRRDRTLRVGGMNDKRGDEMRGNKMKRGMKKREVRGSFQVLTLTRRPSFSHLSSFSRSRKVVTQEPSEAYLNGSLTYFSLVSQLCPDTNHMRRGGDIHEASFYSPITLPLCRRQSHVVGNTDPIWTQMNNPKKEEGERGRMNRDEKRISFHSV